MIQELEADCKELAKKAEEEGFSNMFNLELLRAPKLNRPETEKDQVDELVKFNPGKMSVTDKGRPFLRNACNNYRGQ